MLTQNASRENVFSIRTAENLEKFVSTSLSARERRDWARRDTLQSFFKKRCAQPGADVKNKSESSVTMQC